MWEILMVFSQSKNNSDFYYLMYKQEKGNINNIWTTMKHIVLERLREVSTKEYMPGESA